MLKSVFLLSSSLFLAGASALTLLVPPNPISTPASLDGSANSTTQTNIAEGDSARLGHKNNITITNATLFDGISFHQNVTMIVRDGLIENWGTDLDFPESFDNLDSPIIDGSGHTIMPGLIDSHTHNYLNALEESINFGVTTQIDMFTDVSYFQDVKAGRENLSKTNISDIYSAGMIATAPGGHGTQYGVNVEPITSPDQAEVWVAKRIKEGSDFIKLAYIPDASNNFPSLDRASAAALIKAAHAQGVLAVAHISTQRAAMDMVEEGVDGLVHIFADEPVNSVFIKLAVDKNIFIIPTLTIIASVDGKARGNNLVADERIAPFLTNAQKINLSGSFGDGIKGYSLDVALKNTAILHQAGVSILAGSDAPNPGTSHGISVHDELALFVQAGLTPQDALHAATSLPAQRFSLNDRGVLKKGMRADFIVIEGDIENNIADTVAITAIFKNGYEVERQQPGTQANKPMPLFTNMGNFEKDLFVEDDEVGAEAIQGRFQWVVTTDELVGGKSQASVMRVEPGSDGSKGALRVTADVQAGFIFPWAGAFLPFSQTLSEARNVENYDQISFRVRGTPGNYNVMMFMAAATGVPPSQFFEVTTDWQTIRLKLDDFPGLDKTALAGFAIVVSQSVGVYDYEVDTIRFE